MGANSSQRLSPHVEGRFSVERGSLTYVELNVATEFLLWFRLASLWRSLFTGAADGQLSPLDALVIMEPMPCRLYF